MKELISIVIPVYNVEKYLDKCVNSLVNQTYKNIEIILVNDGSLDNSDSMCDEFAKKDKRIKVIHKENNGVSSARNDGIKAANGKYICFVDGDDYVSCDYVEKLKDNINNDIDLVCCGCFSFDNKKTFEHSLSCNNDKDLLKKSILSNKLAFNCHFFTARNCWAKLYKTSIIKKNNIKFDEDIYLLEDGVFNLEYLKYVNKVSVLNDCLYFYRQIISSASHKYNKDQLEQYNKVEDKILKYIKSDEEKDLYYVIMFQHLLTFISRSIRFKRNKKKNVSDIKFQCNNRYKDTIKCVSNKNLFFSEKVVKFLLKLKLYNLLYCLFIIREKIK